MQNWIDRVKQVKELSRCKKRKVGCIVVNNGVEVAYGFNHGFEELCNCSMTEKNPHVIHAESMALGGSDTDIYNGATLYVTYKPCDKCQVLIDRFKIREVIVCD